MSISAEALSTMAQHMNDDHVEAVVAYARHYGGCADVETATIVRLDAFAMDVKAVTLQGETTVTIPFDHEIVDADDGRTTLIAMYRSASAAV
jgi:putative heme iron utilization protein